MTKPLATSILIGRALERGLCRLEDPLARFVPRVDPAVTKSIHHIEAEGACGTLAIDLANNVAPEDGKASLLTAMSIVRAVRNRAATLRI